MRHLSKIKLPPAIPHIALLWTVIGLLAAACIIALVRVQNVQHHQNDALQTIICKVELAQRNSPLLSAQQKRQDLLFWDKALSDAHLASCT